MVFEVYGGVRATTNYPRRETTITTFSTQQEAEAFLKQRDRKGRPITSGMGYDYFGVREYNPNRPQEIGDPISKQKEMELRLRKEGATPTPHSYTQTESGQYIETTGLSQEKIQQLKNIEKAIKEKPQLAYMRKSVSEQIIQPERFKVRYGLTSDLDLSEKNKNILTEYKSRVSLEEQGKIVSKQVQASLDEKFFIQPTPLFRAIKLREQELNKYPSKYPFERTQSPSETISLSPILSPNFYSEKPEWQGGVINIQKTKEIKTEDLIQLVVEKQPQPTISLTKKEIEEGVGLYGLSPAYLKEFREFKEVEKRSIVIPDFFDIKIAESKLRLNNQSLLFGTVWALGKGTKKLAERTPELVAFGVTSYISPKLALAAALTTSPFAAKELVSIYKEKGFLGLVEETPSAVAFGLTSKYAIAKSPYYRDLRIKSELRQKEFDWRMNDIENEFSTEFLWGRKRVNTQFFQEMKGDYQWVKPQISKLSVEIISPTELSIVLNKKEYQTTLKGSYLTKEQLDFLKPESLKLKIIDENIIKRYRKIDTASIGEFVRLKDILVDVPESQKSKPTILRGQRLLPDMIRTRGEYLGFTSKTTPPNLYLEQLRIQKKFSLLPRITSKEMQTTFYDFPEFIKTTQINIRIPKKETSSVGLNIRPIAQKKRNTQEMDIKATSGAFPQQYSSPDVFVPFTEMNIGYMFKGSEPYDITTSKIFREDIYKPKGKTKIDISNIYKPKGKTKIDISNIYKPKGKTKIDISNIYKPKGGI